MSLSSDVDTSAEQKIFDEALRGRNIHEIRDFQKTSVIIGKANGREEVFGVMGWLNKMFGKPD